MMQLCEDRRGTYLKTEYLSSSRAILTYELPMVSSVPIASSSPPPPS